MADPLTLGAALGIGAGSAAVNLGGSFLGSLFNDNQSAKAVERQIQGAKELMDYEQSNYLSPKAQVKNLGAAGINPAAAFGNTAPVNIGGSSVMPNAQPAMMQVGTQSLSDVASLLVGAAQAKKAGADTGKVVEDTKGVVLDNERKAFENDLMKRFGLQKSAAELALAEQSVKLSQASTDVALQEQSLKKWQAAKEKALSECSENQRDILAKELANKEIELKLRNEKASEEIKTEKSKQSANYASAENSRASASNYRQQARINTVLGDIQESTSDEQIKSQLSRLKADGAISDKDYQDAIQKLEALSGMRDGGIRQKTDDFLIWLKERLNILK